MSRSVLSLDGEWEIEESVGPDEIPQRFGHTVPVPGLASLATPAFPDVGRFDSFEFIQVQMRRGVWDGEQDVEPPGISRQQRNYFWYRRTFRVDEKREQAILKVGKALFGMAVWLNGQKIGEHSSCFSAGYFDLTPAMNWSGENTLLVRVGAHKGAFPKEIPSGTDKEKRLWIPGIYDRVSLFLCDNPVIEEVQVAPRLATSSILVEMVLHNRSNRDVICTLAHRVRTWREKAEVARSEAAAIRLEAGERKTVRAEIAIPDPVLWSPENPFLYVLESSTGSDSVQTRFGMREFRFDTPTRRAYLNGEMIYLRGSNITLHRFFEDPDCGGLPWDEQWVRRLLVEIPRKLHWNTFRFCIGPVPDMWFDIADEAGLLIQNEYPIWVGDFDRHGWSVDAIIQDMRLWMRDCVNHPSVAWWDACNETRSEVLTYEVIPVVRQYDLSVRQWDNGYGPPSGPDDPVEDHPYIIHRKDLDLSALEYIRGPVYPNAPYPTGHAAVINEYGWLWLNRDGSPTLLTKDVWEARLPGATPEERMEHHAYLLAGLTELWRSRREYAGVLHFVYLTCSYPEAYTGDHFKDVRTLEMHPWYLDYLSEAFKPLGVYVNFWRAELEAGKSRRFDVSLINDMARPVAGELTLRLVSVEGKELASARRPFDLPPFGQQTYWVSLDVPAGAFGPVWLRAEALAEGELAPTVCRRKTSIARSPR